jgi:hypothetical protein
VLQENKTEGRLFQPTGKLGGSPGNTEGDTYTKVNTWMDDSGNRFEHLYQRMQGNKKASFLAIAAFLVACEILLASAYLVKRLARVRTH